MYLYMCSFLETKSVALSRGRPRQVKRKGMPLESAPPLNIKFHFSFNKLPSDIR